MNEEPLGPPLIPFDHTSSDAEIRAVLHKHEIRWINRVSGRPDMAYVSRIDNIARRGGHDDYIEFLDKQAGFRAVYLNQIVSVE